MTRTLVLFEDGTAASGGVEADAVGGRDDLPFLSEDVRAARVRAALGDDARDAAAAAARGVLSSPDDDVLLVTFVAPPDWSRFGAALWDPGTGAAHAAFTTATLLVDGVAVPGCAGLPFADEGARRDCAAWCLRNGLDDVAERAARTPVGGPGPHCTWPDADLGPFEDDREEPRRAEAARDTPAEPEGATGEPVRPRGADGCDGTNVVSLFGGVVHSPGT